MSHKEFVPIRAICEELTSYGFSYKFGDHHPVVLPWKLSEFKARQRGLYHEGEKDIRQFWETQVRPKLPDEFYKQKNIDDMFWVDQARKLAGFDGPEFKDRFASARRFYQAQAVNLANAVAVPVGMALPAAAAAAAPGVPPVPAAQPATVAPPTIATHAITTIATAASALPTAAIQAPAATVFLPVAAVTGAEKRKCESIESTTTTTSSAAAPNPPKKTKKKKKVVEVVQEEEKVHYQDLLLQYPPNRAATMPLAERFGLPSTAHHNNRHQQQQQQFSTITTTSTATTKKMENAPWLKAKEQAELFESLYARVAVLTDAELQQASQLLERGDPKMIGLVKAYHGQETDEGGLGQFKRVLATLLAP